MARNAVLWICVIAVALTWSIFLVDDPSLARAIAFVKSQNVELLGIASAIAAAVALVLLLLPRLRNRTNTSSPSAPQNAEPGEAQPPCVTPKRVANLKLDIRDRLMQDVGSVLSSGIEVRHLMSDGLESVHPDTKLEDVKKLMEEKGIRHLAVTRPGEYGHLSGIISDRDVASRRGGYARDIMTPSPVSICHGAKIQEAIDMMVDRGISCLPVRRGEINCGIVTTTDMMIGLRATYELLRTLVPDEQFATVGGSAEEL